MKQLPPELLARILLLAPEGVVVCAKGEGGWPVAYANPAFERLTGYPLEELRGKDLRILQTEGGDNSARQKLRQAIEAGDSCRAMLRNRRKDGSLFWNEMLLEPVKNGAGEVTHFIGFHRDAGERLRMEPRNLPRESFGLTGAFFTPLSSVRDDRLTGLYNKEYFDELLRRDWAIAQREGRQLSMMMFDVDCLGTYNDTFGRAAGDACIRRVARAIGACLRRGSDLAARLEGGTIVALTHGMDADKTRQFAELLLERVREQSIHHPRSPVQRFVTVSVGTVSLTPEGGQPCERLYEAAREALKEAKQAGRNCVRGR